MKKAIIIVLLIALAAVIFLGLQKSGPQTVEFTVKNFANTELGKVNVTYTQPLNEYTACDIATAAAAQTSLQAFKCTGFNKEGEDFQIVYQPSPANIYVFTISEKEKLVVINIGQAN